MLQYLTPKEVINHKGLRIILVKGLPSPWGQAAKTFFEIKALDYVAAPLLAGDTNDDIVAWSGENSAPIVAWGDAKPIHRWIDILYLAERLAPKPALIPSDPAQRALMIGLSHELCGELGIGWNRRLQMFAPAIESGKAPAGITLMGNKYGYNSSDAQAAGARTAATLTAFTAQLKAQYARGSRFLVGDALFALDIYWVAFMNLLDPLPSAQCPIPEDWRPAFVPSDPAITAALDPILVEHRDKIFRSYFRNPMEL